MGKKREIEVGSIVTVKDGHVGCVSRLYPGIRSDTQLKVTAVVNRDVYRMGAYQVIRRPEDEPITPWKKQVKLLPAKARPSDVWAPKRAA